MAHQWYAIQTYAGSERAVKRAIEQMKIDYHLEDKIDKVVVPTEEVIEIKNGEKKITEKSLYPGYVFAHIDLDCFMA
jgi:transcriptional antiterminator NusG